MKFLFILLLFLNVFFENFVINDVFKEVIAKLHNGLCYNNLSCQAPPPPKFWFFVTPPAALEIDFSVKPQNIKVFHPSPSPHLIF